MKAIKILEKRKNILFIFGVINILFFILYREFIFENNAYIYSDIGSDTFFQYFPSYVFGATQFQNGNLIQYSLQKGFGGTFFEQILGLLNPFEFFLLLCNNETMYIGLIISLYIKVIFIGIISYLFFDRIFLNDHAKIICSIIWTFCSYNTLWAQHYTFLTCMAYFTIFMFCLQVYIESEKFLSRWIPLIVFLYCVRSYYFLYMTGIFGVIYISVYGLLKGVPLKNTLKKIFGLGCMAVLGICMAALVFLVTIGNFFGSDRSEGVSSSLLSEIFDFRTFKYLYSTIARYISNNILGVGDSFLGWGNYYESPMLFTSGLFGFSFLYSISEKKCWKKRWLYFVGIFSVFNVFVSIVMTGFSGTYVRWTFIICWGMVFSIGYMLDQILEEKNTENKRRKRTAVLGIVMNTIICAWILFFVGEKIEKKVLIISFTFFVFYSIWLFLYNGQRHMVFLGIIYVLILSEVICSNVSSISERDILTSKESQSYRTDGTIEIIDYMKEVDEGIYRTKKDYATVQLNDALVQGINGFSCYDSVLPTSVNNYMEENMVPAMLYDSCIEIPTSRYTLLTLLGMKYLIVNDSQKVDAERYMALHEINNKVLYENKYALPFGYLYTNITEKESLLHLPDNSRDGKLTKYCYFTDEVSENTSKWDTENDLSEVINLFDQKFNIVHARARLEKGIMKLKAIDEDMQIEFRLPRIATEDSILGVEMDIKVKKPTTIQMYWRTQNEAFSDEREVFYNITPKQTHYSIPMELSGSIDYLRVDPSTIQQDVVIENLSLIIGQREDVIRNLENLRENSLQEIKFENNVLTGKIINNKGKEAILCIPIFFEKSWCAYIDGKKEEVCNINGGLIGIPITAGYHKVELVYNNTFMSTGFIVSTVSWIFYIALFWTKDLINMGFKMKQVYTNYKTKRGNKV